MTKTWDLSNLVRGKALATLFATTAMCAGAQALAPSLSSAERTNCTTEPQGCDGESGGGGDAGSSTGTGSDGFDNLFGHDQIARFPGDLSVLTEDCRKLSSGSMPSSSGRMR